MSFNSQNFVSLYSQNAGITSISKGAFYSATAPSSTTINGPLGPFKLGNFILTAAGALYYLQALTSSANVPSATWTLIQSSGSSGGILPVANGGTGVATLTGIPLGSGTSAFSALTYTGATSWTPTLLINGSATGITYTTQVGLYTQIGSIVTFNFNIILSSKGASNGAVSINVPVTTGANGNQNRFNVMFAATTLTANYTNISLNLGNASTACTLTQYGSAQTIASLTDTQLANTSNLWCTGTYLIG